MPTYLLENMVGCLHVILLIGASEEKVDSFVGLVAKNCITDFNLKLNFVVIKTLISPLLLFRILEPCALWEGVVKVHSLSSGKGEMFLCAACQLSRLT